MAATTQFGVDTKHTPKLKRTSSAERLAELQKPSEFEPEEAEKKREVT